MPDIQTLPRRWDDLADRILAGETPGREEALSMLEAPDSEVLEILAAAYRIRRRYFGNRVKLNYLVNAKSGNCSEDCGYCTQSSRASSEIDRYPLLDHAALVESAQKAVQVQATTCCIVMSGRAPSDRDVDQVCAAVQDIKKTNPELRICACLGFLKEDQAEKLRASGVDRYNHNLNTAESYHEEICTTHTYDDRVNTVNRVREAGLSPCAGIIIGMGESHDHIVDMAFSLRDIGADSIPVNFLLPAEGTKFGDRDTGLNPRFCLKVLSLFRFVCPDREIRTSAGREVHLRTLQPMALYAANSLFVSDYLTEPGQAPRLDLDMIEDLGFTTGS